MKTKRLIYASMSVFFLLLSLSPALAVPDTTYKMLERFHVSLGNSTCNELECNIASLFFYVPVDRDTTTAQLTVIPECFNYTFGGGDVWNVTIICEDGSDYEYDMATAMCDYSQNFVFDVEINSTGYFYYDEDKYESFWCAFYRNSNNVEDLPTEFSIVVDGVGLHSKFIDSQTEANYGIQSNMALILENLVMMMADIWEIGYTLFLLFSFLFGITFIIAIIPMALRWIVKKVIE